MYAAEIPETAGPSETRQVTLSVSGELWQRSLVMLDLETKSRWSHLLGRAMDGPLKGAELEPLLSDMTTWAEWKSLHPDTTVINMARTHEDYTARSLRLASPFVLGFRTDAGNWSIPFTKIAQNSLLNFSAEGEPMLAVWNSENGVVRLFSRRVDGKTLEFEAGGDGAGRLIDTQTKSIWNATSGQAESGAFAGQILKPRISIVSLTDAWMNFHPDTREPELVSAP